PDHEAAMVPGQPDSCAAGSNTSTAPMASPGPITVAFPAKSPEMPACSGTPYKSLGSATANRSTAKRNVRRWHAKPVDESSRLQHVDLPARSHNGQAAVDSGCLCTGESLDKIPLHVGLLGNHDNARDSCDAVGVPLESQIPEILRIALLASSEMNLWHCCII